MDHITIDNLEIFANHGVYDEEVALGQKFVISAELYFDSYAAGITDDLEKTINYAQVCSYIAKFVKEHTFKLIETIAESVARGILTSYELVDKVSITVKKPWAPIGQPLDSVMVTINRGWNTVILSIGSNMGDTKEHLDYAVNALSNNSYIKEVKSSSYIVTKPYGDVEQDDFLNGAVKLKTVMTPQELLDYLHSIEKERGRERLVHWGPRTLDLDIVFYGDECIYNDNLVIPHPDMANRRFVLEPICEIAPYYIHPVKKKTVAELLSILHD